MTSEKPKDWVKWIPLAEYWYNINYHSAIDTTPYEAVYGQAPPMHIPYMAKDSPVEAVDMTLQAREQVVQLLKFNLKQLAVRQDRQRLWKRLGRAVYLISGSFVKLAKNNEAKMVLYNALPKKEYQRIFMCKTAKDIWQSLLITHQGNSQVKDNKIDLLVQQYEHITILEEESIDSGFARFNTIITSLKALDEGFSSKNYVRKFLRALHPKWRAKVTAIEESKDLSSLALDELIGNLKVHEVVMEKDSKIYRGKKERVKSIALKAKKESSDDETSTSGSDDEEYAMAVRNFKKFFRRKGKFVRQPREEKKSFRQRDEKKGKSDRKCFRCGDPNHLIGDCPKPSRNKDQKAFIGGSWSDSENDAEDKTNDETCLMAQSSNEVCLRTCLEPDEWIKDSGCSKHMTGNKSLFSTYKAYDGGNVVFGSNLKGKIIGKGKGIRVHKLTSTVSMHPIGS
ncbi:zf-CCHC domain-containing protein [Tanacetum coccineum]